MEESMNQLLTKIDMDISYLSSLDYIDMRTLCISSKQLSYICKDNTILRSIIYNKSNDIEISPNFDISSALKDIYDSIQKVIDVNYSELPRWVNKKLFNDDMLRDFMIDFIDIFSNEISNMYPENKQSFRKISTIKLYKPVVAAVLYSDDLDYEDFDRIKSDIPHEVIIPASFYEYIIPTINKIAEYIEIEDVNNGYYDLDYKTLSKVLSDMLFIN